MHQHLTLNKLRMKLEATVILERRGQARLCSPASVTPVGPLLPSFREYLSSEPLFLIILCCHINMMFELKSPCIVQFPIVGTQNLMYKAKGKEFYFDSWIQGVYSMVGWPQDRIIMTEGVVEQSWLVHGGQKHRGTALGRSRQRTR